MALSLVWFERRFKFPVGLKTKRKKAKLIRKTRRSRDGTVFATHNCFYRTSPRSTTVISRHKFAPSILRRASF